ncbi:MAG: MFS transporter [Deltaproteobacteria bacterium]|nr:MFS transporter [Deltaproteobacteria bacterium]
MTSPNDYSNLGRIVYANNIITDNLDPRRIRKVIWLLAGSVALMMTGYGIIMPVFAKRFGELGSGVGALGLMTMSFALAQLVAAPFMGALADRIGRRPLVVVSLAVFALSNVGFLFAPAIAIFILIRTLEGALTAGLFPASMGIVADLVPENKRAHWIGIVMGSYSAGFIFGPAIGGALYDWQGFSAPFMVSAVFGFLGFVAACLLVPETRTAKIRNRDRLRGLRNPLHEPIIEPSFLSTLPRPRYIFYTLMALNFIGSFAFSFIEPQMVFYFYDDLKWSTTRFGLVVGVFGLAMVSSQMILGRSSDRFGRRPVIVIGFLLSLSFYVGLAYVQLFSLIMVVAFISGVGDALKGPAISAFYLDITKKEHRSRIIGIKESALSLGGVLGPALVAIISGRTSPQTIFMIGALTTLIGGILALLLLGKQKGGIERDDDAAWALMEKRQLAAQACLHGVVTWAITSRKTRRS